MLRKAGFSDGTSAQKALTASSGGTHRETVAASCALVLVCLIVLALVIGGMMASQMDSSTANCDSFNSSSSGSDRKGTESGVFDSMAWQCVRRF